MIRVCKRKHAKKSPVAAEIILYLHSKVNMKHDPWLGKLLTESTLNINGLVEHNKKDQQTETETESPGVYNVNVPVV